MVKMVHSPLVMNNPSVKSNYRKNSFKTRMDAILPEKGTFTIIYHELWREMEGGWSTNSSWYGARKCSREEAINHLRGRWEVVKCNYLPKGRVSDLEDANWDDVTEILLECSCVPVANIRVEF